MEIAWEVLFGIGISFSIGIIFVWLVTSNIFSSDQDDDSEIGAKEKYIAFVVGAFLGPVVYPMSLLGLTIYIVALVVLCAAMSYYYGVTKSEKSG